MGRLTTIEDVEKRREDESGMEPAAVKPAAQEVPAAAPKDTTERQSIPKKKSAAQAELEFHGLDNQEKRTAGHTFLVVAAVIVVVAVAVNFANYTLHFF